MSGTDDEGNVAEDTDTATVTLTFTISGTKVQDHTGGGFGSSNTTPTTTFTINLYVDANGNGVLDAGDGSPVQSVSTNAGGFYAFKGLLEAAAAKLGDGFAVRPLENAPGFLHPGIAGEVVWNGAGVGVVGAVHPRVLEAWELPSGTLVAELRLPLPPRSWVFADPSRQPAALRDLAVIAPKSVPYSRLVEIVRGAAGSFLEAVEPFDVFAGGRIPEGSRSVAVRLTFRAQDRTLTDEEANAALSGVGEAMKREGFEVRER